MNSYTILYLVGIKEILSQLNGKFEVVNGRLQKISGNFKLVGEIIPNLD